MIRIGLTAKQPAALPTLTTIGTWPGSVSSLLGEVEPASSAYKVLRNFERTALILLCQ